MQRFLRVATPLILVSLALLVWFESLLRNEAATPWLGETGVIRFALGILCLYLLVVVVEQQRMGTAFREVLLAFKRFNDSRGGEGGESRMEAAGLLVGALAAEDPKIRANAVDHLKRLTGQDFGEDRDRWQKWLQEADQPVGDP